MVPANATAPDLCAECKAIYEKATLVKETAKVQKNTAGTKIVQFYKNLLSSDAKYAWNKIVREKTEADPYKDLKGVSRVSHSTNGLCSTFSLCFPTTQQSKKALPFQRAQEAPAGWCTSVRTARIAAQRLRCAATLLVPQPQLRCWYVSSKGSIH